MKRMVIAGLLLISGTAAMALEHPDNPDRFPSIGLNYTGIATTGDTTVTASGISAKQDSDTTTGILSADLRLPVSRSVTLNAALGLVGSQATATETPLLNGGEIEEGGLMFNVGVRFYLH